MTNSPIAVIAQAFRNQSLIPAASNKPARLDRVNFEPELTLRRPALAGIIAITIGFGGFLLWSVTANIDSAAIANGSVIVDSKKKTVSHLEGGILKRLLVAEGDVVKAGQPLLELDGTRAQADLAAGRGEMMGLVAKLARLRAERDQTENIAFPADLLQAKSDIATSVMTDERHLFDMRKDIYQAKMAAAERQVDQFAAETTAVAAQADAAARQKDLVGTQVANIRTLVEKGAATERQVSDLETQLSEIQGRLGQFTAEKAKAEQGKAAAVVALLSVRIEWQGDIATDIQDTQLKLNDVAQRVAAATDVLERLTLRAPEDGTVLNIQVRTPGSAVTAGEPILDIIPVEQPLVVETRLNPSDIMNVHVGAAAQILLTGYNMRTHPPLDGRVTYVAADQTEDPQRGTSYYVIRAVGGQRGPRRPSNNDPLPWHARRHRHSARVAPSHRLHSGTADEDLLPRFPRRIASLRPPGSGSFGFAFFIVLISKYSNYINNATTKNQPFKHSMAINSDDRIVVCNLKLHFYPIILARRLLQQGSAHAIFPSWTSQPLRRVGDGNVRRQSI